MLSDPNKWLYKANKLHHYQEQRINYKIQKAIYCKILYETYLELSENKEIHTQSPKYYLEVMKAINFRYQSNLCDFKIEFRKQGNDYTFYRVK